MSKVIPIEKSRKAKRKRKAKENFQSSFPHCDMMTEAIRITNFPQGDLNKWAALAKLARLLKADPDKVLAFINSAEEPSKVVELRTEK